MRDAGENRLPGIQTARHLAHERDFVAEFGLRFKAFTLSPADELFAPFLGNSATRERLRSSFSKALVLNKPWDVPKIVFARETSSELQLAVLRADVETG